MQKEKIYIAYGSNLNLPQMAYRCPNSKVLGKSEIKDYEITFRGSKTGSYATIEACEGAVVPVLLWSVNQRDEMALDRYEGYPRFYEKKNIELELEGKMVSAFVYVMTDGHELGMPSEHYLKSIKEGYKTAGFDVNILKDAIEKTADKILIELENKSEQESHFSMRWW